MKAQLRSKTSVGAARAGQDIAPTQRQVVLSVLALSGKRGLTDEEIQKVTEMNANTQRPRRVELVEAGLVVDSQRVRNTTFGRPAVVWVAVMGRPKETKEAKKGKGREVTR